MKRRAVHVDDANAPPPHSTGVQRLALTLGMVWARNIYSCASTGHIQAKPIKRYMHAHDLCVHAKGIWGFYGGGGDSVSVCVCGWHE